MPVKHMHRPVGAVGVAIERWTTVVDALVRLSGWLIGREGRINIKSTEI